MILTPWTHEIRYRDRGLLIMLCGIVVITPDSLLVRLMQLEGGSTVDQNLQSVFWKFLLSVPLTSSFIVWQAGGLHKLARELERTSTSGVCHIAMSALAFAFTAISINLAFVTTRAARALLGFGLNPLWAAFMARLVLGQPVPARTLVALLLVTCAICVVCMPEIVPSLGEPHNKTGQIESDAYDASSVEPTLQGDLCGISAGVALGAMIVVNASAKKKCPEAVMLLSGVLGSALVVLASLAWQAAAGRASMGAVSGRFVGLAFANSILLCLVNAATVTAPRYASSAEVGMVTPLEAVLGPIWVYIGVGETPSKWTIMGGALLVGSLIGHEVWGCRSEAHSSKPAAAAVEISSPSSASSKDMLRTRALQ